MDPWGPSSDILWQPVAACGNLWQRDHAPYRKNAIMDACSPGGLEAGGMDPCRLEAWITAVLEAAGLD